MQIVSFEFLFFFACVTLIYYVIPARFRCAFLLLASYIFYGSQDIRYLVFLGTATLFSYGCALLLEHPDTAGTMKRRGVFGMGIALNLGMLGYFKYAGFFTGGRINSLILPIGISFYLFMSCGYLTDVYKRRLPAERNLIRYALFISFFPTVLSGPIERAGNMLPQFATDFMDKVCFDTERIRDGLVRVLWGYFMKLVLADRIAILVNTVYASPEGYGGALVMLTTVLYTFQIYCDFAGYSHIAIGIAKVLGINVMENFKCPYLARSISDFWRRWHISLSSWFRDYVYIPLGGNRKGISRKYVNILIVFLLSGLWHGAGWTFILWGGLHGAYQVAGNLLMPARRKINGIINPKGKQTVLQIFITFSLVNLAWIFFRADNLKSALQILNRFAHPALWELFDGTIQTLGLDVPNLVLMAAGLLLVIAVDLLNERGIYLFGYIAGECILVRWPVYIAAILLVLICGIWGTGYDTTSFIYYQF